MLIFNLLCNVMIRVISPIAIGKEFWKVKQSGAFTEKLSYNTSVQNE